MMSVPPGNRLQNLKNFFDSGKPQSYEFRREQLQKLRKGILRHEKDLHQALWNDLKKSPEESWVTETGFVISEINYSLRNLRSWMRPKKVRTNLLNFPSSSYIHFEPLGVV